MSELSFAVAFAAGLVSFLSPCVLPLIPAFLTYLAGSSLKELETNDQEAKRRVFASSILFVLGFSAVFSLLGVLLQSILLSVAYDIKTYLGYLGGSLIIVFGLHLMGLLKISLLDTEHKISLEKTKTSYITSFVFGAAFAVGWTPCVGPVLGAILSLAVTEPQSAFPLMLTYAVGLGLPFIIVGASVTRAQKVIRLIGPHLKTLNIVFGALLVILGILVFTNQLAAVANFGPVNDLIMRFG